MSFTSVTQCVVTHLAGRGVCLAAFTVFIAPFFIASPASAELSAEQSAAEETAASVGFLETVWGQPAMDSVYLGMWSYHFIDDNDEYQSTHNLIGLTYQGIFAGTFLNSRDNRAWGLGWQRDVYKSRWGALNAEIGYRLGILYGYEKMELWDTGVFPLLQVYSDVRFKNIGMQFSWGGSAVTAGFFVRY